MLKLRLTHPETKETADFDLISESNAMYEKFQEYGIVAPLFAIHMKDMRAEDAPIRVVSDSDIGNALINLLDDKESLYDVRQIDSDVSGIRDELKEEIEQNLVYEQFHDIDHLYRDIKRMTKDLAANKVIFYCPLTAQLNDHEGDYYETHGYTINCNAYKIEEALEGYQARDVCMAEYVGDHANIKDKLVFAEWGVEEIRGTLYGRIDCYITEDLTLEETARLREALEGQNSDGFGEGFEQHEIRIDEGDLYVSFWNSGDSYFLDTEDEFYERIEQGSGMTM